MMRLVVVDRGVVSHFRNSCQWGATDNFILKFSFKKVFKTRRAKQVAFLAILGRLGRISHDKKRSSRLAAPFALSGMSI